MHDKPRKSKELLVLQSLHPRMNLSLEEKQHFENLEKGYQGEITFYHQLKEYPFKHQLILYDLLLISNKTEFQVDSLLVIWSGKIRSIFWKLKILKVTFTFNKTNGMSPPTEKKLGIPSCN